MKKEMLINVLQSEECRIAILEDGVLEELYVERASHESYVGNIYKGKIVNIEPSIQAAFVDFGVGRNGFLHVSDVEPTYYRHMEPRRGDRDRDRDRGDRRGNGRDRFRSRDRDRDRDRDRERDLPRPLPPAYLEEPVLEQTESDLAEPAEEVTACELETPEEVVEKVPPQVAEDFAAGVDLEPPRSHEKSATSPEAPPVVETPAAVEKAPVAEQAPAAASPVEDETSKPPLVALPETRIEEDTGKPRRRSRGTTATPRRRTRSTPAGETPAEEAAPQEAPKAEGENPPAETPKPRLMDSAERRTEKNSGPEAAHELSPAPGGGEDFDPDLFFPPEPPQAAQQPEAPPPVETPAAPEKAPERRPSQAANVVSIPPAPRRARPPKSHGSIEDALIADLAEAEIGEDETPPEIDLTEPVENLPAARVEARRPVEPEEEPDEERIPAPFDSVAAERDVEEEDDDFDDEFPRRSRGDRDRRGGDSGGRRRRPGISGLGRPGAGRPKPLIQDIFKRGQEVIVQVIKEGIGTKGPTLSTYISIPGRYLVLMPCLNRTGVSRKIEDDEQRRRLRQMFNELKPPRGLGFIMRTAAIDKNKKEVQRDLVYLSRLWQVVVRRIRKMKAPAEIYQESEMVTRTIRDNFTSDIDTIWVDEARAFEAAQEFMQVVMPRYADRIKLYDGKEPLFHRFGIEDEIARIQQKKVPLPHGGSIVLEQTEALVAIDVNSGNFRADNNAEETAYQMNLHAAKEIARQLRLRDLGGVIVNDFIDMRDEKHRRSVEKALRDAMRRDRARTKILKISQFGLIEMTRQRVRPSLKRSGYQDCPYCKGMAQVKTPETMSLEAMRLIQLASTREVVQRVEITVASDVADYLLNKKRREIVKMEEEGQMSVQIRGVHGAPPELCDFICLDRNDNEVRLAGPEPVTFRPRR